jgi:hypothetical protein
MIEIPVAVWPSKLQEDPSKVVLWPTCVSCTKVFDAQPHCMPHTTCIAMTRCKCVPPPPLTHFPENVLESNVTVHLTLHHRTGNMWSLGSTLGFFASRRWSSQKMATRER